MPEGHSTVDKALAYLTGGWDSNIFWKNIFSAIILSGNPATCIRSLSHNACCHTLMHVPLVRGEVKREELRQKPSVRPNTDIRAMFGRKGVKKTSFVKVKQSKRTWTSLVPNQQKRVSNSELNNFLEKTAPEAFVVLEPILGEIMITILIAIATVQKTIIFFGRSGILFCLWPQWPMLKMLFCQNFGQSEFRQKFRRLWTAKLLIRVLLFTWNGCFL